MLLLSLFQRQGWNAARNKEGQTRQDNASLRHAKPRVRFVPRLEALEDRTVPSYVFQNLLDDPSAGTGPGQGTQPNAINSSGEIVGLYLDSHSVRHSYSQIGNQYTNFDPPNEGTVRPFSIATGINPEGQTVGAYRGTDGLSHGYLLSGGQFTFFNDPLAVFGTRTFGINAPGQIVGEYLDANFTIRGFLLSAGKFTTIDDPLGVGAQGGTQPSQINDLGQIVGGYFDATGLVHGYIQIGNQFTTVDDSAGNPPGQGSFINGNDDLGQLVGGYVDATGLEHGFLATPSQGNSARAATSGGGSESVFGTNLILSSSLMSTNMSGTVSATPGMASSGTGVPPSPAAIPSASAMAPAQATAGLTSQSRLDQRGHARSRANGP